MMKKINYIPDMKAYALILLKELRELAEYKSGVDYINQFYSEAKINSLDNEEDLDGFLSDMESDKRHFKSARDKREQKEDSIFDYEDESNWYLARVL